MIGGIGAPIGTPVGGVLNVGATLGAGAANFEFAVSGSGDGQTALVGSAALDLIVDGRIEALLEGAGSVSLEIAADGIGALLFDGSGAAAFDFAAAGIGSFNRIASRVIHGVASAKRGTTIYANKASQLGITAKRASTVLTGTSSQTRPRNSRSHTEIYNG